MRPKHSLNNLYTEQTLLQTKSFTCAPLFTRTQHESNDNKLYALIVNRDRPTSYEDCC